MCKSLCVPVADIGENILLGSDYIIMDYILYLMVIMTMLL